MKDIDVLSKTTRYTMGELRAHRAQLMADRIDLIDRYRRCSKGRLIAPYLESARVPTARKPEDIQKQYVYPWIQNIVLDVVYRAVRKVEVDIPYREKIQYYTSITDSYVNLIGEVIDRTVKTNAITEIADSIWKALLSKEITAVVRQCIGEIDMAESTAGNIILQAILSVNRKLNPADEDHRDDEEALAKNIMKEMSLERNKQKTVRFYHRLPTVPLSILDKGGKNDQGRSEPTELELDMESIPISGVQNVDIRSLEKRYLPNDFAKFVDAELAVWKNVEIIDQNIYDNDVVSGFYASPSTHSAIITMRNSVVLIGDKNMDTSTLGKLNIPHVDFIHCSWSESERSVLLTTDKGSIYCVALYHVQDNDDETTHRHGNHSSFLQSETSVPLSVLWKADSSGLSVTEGVFKADNKTHVPVISYFAPLFTAWGEQPVVLVGCDNHDILRLCTEVTPSDALLLPEDIPTFEEIKNTTANSMKVDICEGHRHHIQEIISTSEYVFLSVDSTCCIIEWQYSKHCFDAYGRVTPKRYIVKGNDVDYIRLVKNVTNMYNAKSCKTRQDIMMAAKKAESDFKDLGLGDHPHNYRENDASKMKEETFMSTKTVQGETFGVIVIRKHLGNQLYSMKLRQFKVLNTPPSAYLAMAVSTDKTLLGFAFLFKTPQYSMPYISFVLITASTLTVLRNKIKLKLTPELVETLQKSHDAFSFCITPPLKVTKSSYLIVKIGKSLMMISVATSTILRTTLDVHEYTRDPNNSLYGKHVALLSGRLTCHVYGAGTLVVHGTHQPQEMLLLNLAEPSVKEGEDRRTLYYQSLGRANELSKVVDPEFRRVFVESRVFWGKIYQGYVERTDTINFIRKLLFGLIDAVFDGDRNGASANFRNRNEPIDMGWN